MMPLLEAAAAVFATAELFGSIVVSFHVFTPLLGADVLEGLSTQNFPITLPRSSVPKEQPGENARIPQPQTSKT